MMTAIYVILAVIGFVVLFSGIWTTVVLLISLTSGWSRLAQLYRLNGTLPPDMQSVPYSWVGSGRYRGGALRVAVRPEGLYLAVMPLFRLGHPPLLIPWEAMRQMEHEQRRFGPVTHLLVDIGGRALSIRLPPALLDPAQPFLIQE